MNVDDMRDYGVVMGRGLADECSSRHRHGARAKRTGVSPLSSALSHSLTIGISLRTACRRRRRIPWPAVPRAIGCRASPAERLVSLLGRPVADPVMLELLEP